MLNEVNASESKLGWGDRNIKHYNVLIYSILTKKHVISSYFCFLLQILIPHDRQYAIHYNTTIICTSMHIDSIYSVNLNYTIFIFDTLVLSFLLLVGTIQFIWHLLKTSQFPRMYISVCTFMCPANTPIKSLHTFIFHLCINISKGTWCMLVIFSLSAKPFH